MQQQEEILWMVIFDMLEQYKYCYVKIHLCTHGHRLLNEMQVYQRIVTEHFWIILLYVTSI